MAPFLAMFLTYQFTSWGGNEGKREGRGGGGGGGGGEKGRGKERERKLLTFTNN